MTTILHIYFPNNNTNTDLDVTGKTTEEIKAIKAKYDGITTEMSVVTITDDEYERIYNM